MLNSYHFIGIGGVGMSALAEAALLSGLRVTGSDRLLDSGEETGVLAALRSSGAKLFAQDGSGITDETDCVVVSTAIEADNPDLLEAERRKIAVRHRSEVLASLLKGRGRRVAVTGTCGKSTVTAMIGWMLAQADKDPFVINGAPLADWMSERCVGSSRAGRGPCVFEADESDKSLLNCGCEVAVITNSSADHFSKDEADALFDAFAESAAELVVDARGQHFFDDVSLSSGRFEYAGRSFVVNMPGRHNVLNAVIAVKTCELLGCSADELQQALASFRGVSRRLERIGAVAGVTVYDDYAHNTEKIRATWRTLSETYGSVVGVWRPHGYGPLRSMMNALVGMFSEVMGENDSLFLLPVYDAGGTAERTLNSDELASRLSGAGKRAVCVENTEQAVAAACESVRETGAVVVMGARDPALPFLARSILAGLSG